MYHVEQLEQLEQLEQPIKYLPEYLLIYLLILVKPEGIRIITLDSTTTEWYVLDNRFIAISLPDGPMDHR